MKTKKNVKVASVLFMVGAVLLTFGLVFQRILDAVIDKILKDKLALREGTIAYKLWMTPPVPISFNLYVFDVINPEEVAKGLEQPVVVEKGPYVHRMRLHKTNISHYNHNDSISYVQPQVFHFDREASVGSLNDTFTNVNVPFITISAVLEKWPVFIQKAVNDLFKGVGETGFKKMTINDIFWGYEDPILGEIYKITQRFGIHIDFLQEKFGFFASLNNSGDGYYNVYSAANGNLDNYCRIHFWNRESKMNIWSTDKANAIEGTDGSMHPPYVSSNSHLKIFDAYLRRTLKMNYVKETSYKGLDTLHFVVPYTEFANATVNPDAAGFCTPNTDYCFPSGNYNLSVAAYGAPMSVSMPHFCGGDPYYQRQVRGLHPDPEKHQPFYDIHALTGVSIRGSRRYQINIQTKRYQHFTAYNNFTFSYLPVVWIDGLSVIDDKNLDQFKNEIQLVLEIMTYVRAFIIGTGGVLLLTSLCLFGYRYYKFKQNKKSDTARDIVTNGHQTGSTQHAGLNGAVGTEREPLLNKA